MPQATSNNYFSKPAVGGDTDTWGSTLNTNWDTVDSVLAGDTDILALSVVPASTTDVAATFSGLVGIGTTNPARDLSIGDGTGSPNIQLLAASSGNSRIEFGDTDDSDAGEIQYVHSTNYMQFTTNGTERLRIDSSGNVGIGTDSPDSILDVVGADPILTIRDTSTSGADSHATLRLAESDGSGNVNVRFDVALDEGDLTFDYSNGATTSERMRIDASGNVGIGTDNPDALLTVQKDVSTAYDKLDDDAQRSNTSTLLIKNEDGTNNSFAQIAFDLAGTNQSVARIVGIRSATSASELAFVTEENNNKHESMRMSHSGHIGINQSTPNYELHISPKSVTDCVLRLDNITGKKAIIDLAGYHISKNAGQAGFSIIEPNEPTTICQFLTSNEAGYIVTGVAGTTPYDHTSSNGGVAIGLDGIQIANFGSSALYLNKSGWGATSTTYRDQIRFYWNGSQKGSVKTNSNQTQYNTTSDERLKENIQEANDAGSIIDSIQVRQFDWRETGAHQEYGFVAQELYETYPDAVGGTPDELDENDNILYMGVDHSKLVPLLIKEVQSLRSRVAELESP